MKLMGDSATDRKSGAEELLNAVGLSNQINEPKAGTTIR